MRRQRRPPSDGDSPMEAPCSSSRTCRRCATRCSSRRSRDGTTRARPPRPRSSTSPPSGTPRPIAALDPEDYYDFQVNRPKVMRDDGQRRIVWPTTRILVARDTGFGSRDVVLVEGIEPSTRWRAFTIELLEYAERLGVSTFVTLGALLADVPHTRPIPVTATSDDEDVLHRLDLEPSAYEGPTGIVGVISDAAHRAGLPSLSCWAAVPHYAGQLTLAQGHPRPARQARVAVQRHHPARRPAGVGAGVGARRQRARGVRRGGGRVRPVPRGVDRHRRPARGERRRDRPRVRALPAPPRRRGHSRRPERSRSSVRC